MMTPVPSPAGRHLLDRRNFLGHLGGGLGGIERRLTDVHGHVITDILA
jgi:hypothetical protein